MAQVVQDDEAQVRFNLINQSDRLARDLTGGSADFIFSIDAGVATTAPMTLEDASQGRVSFRFSPGDLVPGVLRADVRSTDINGNTVIARDIVRIQIRRKIT